MTAPEFQEKLDAEIGDASALVVDFSKVNYISSAGLCVLLFYGQEMEDRKGSIKAICVRKTLHKVFELTGFLEMLQL